MGTFARHNFFKNRIPIYKVKGDIKQYQTFGEIALSYTNRRTATIVANERTFLLSLSKKAFQDVCQRANENTGNFLKFLKDSFPGLSHNSLANLLCTLKEKRVRLGKKLMTTGQIPKHCYIVKKGRVKLMTKFVKTYELPEGDLGKLRMRTKLTYPNKQVEISLVGPGSIIGDKEVLLEKPSNFDAIVATEGSVLYEITALVCSKFTDLF
jgi:cAMP-dependent protein kinase regulator